MSTPLHTTEPTPDLLPAYDVVVVGGGPAGTTFAWHVARAGHRVLVIEKARHPRFAIGESLLPATVPLWKEMGLFERFEREGFLRKFGAYFAFAECDDPEYFHFPDAARAKAPYSFEVPRARFDQILWEEAEARGAHCLDRTEVLEFLRDGERVRGVRVRLEDGTEREVAARLTADCSGRATLLGRELGLRVPDKKLNKVALYAHYDDVIRSTGDDEGTLAILATDFGWAWIIPFAKTGTSVGLVMSSDAFARRIKGTEPEALYDAIVAEVPGLRSRLAGATRKIEVRSTANYSYRCSRASGPGWVLAGDAGAFLDPVFSSGVHLAMTGARAAAEGATSALSAGRDPAPSDFRRYERRQRAALGVFSHFIYAWYDPSFRKVFMRIPRDRRAVTFLKERILSVLAGDVFEPWRVLPYIYVLLGLGRLQRWADARGWRGPARPKLPPPY